MSRNGEADKPKSSSSKPSKPITHSSLKVLSFWAYLTLFISLLTLLLSFSSYPSSRHDPAARFLSLPAVLRRHHSRGRLLKASAADEHRTIELFAVEDGPQESETVFLIHGLGSSSFSFRKVIDSLASAGIRAVAIDLPGSGFSDRLGSSRRGGILGSFWGVYDDIREKGLFWGFDQLIETGQYPLKDTHVGALSENGIKKYEYGAEEISSIVGQVVDSMALAPLHLVLHDSALAVGANWVSANPSAVRSVTIIDAAGESAAFPSWVLWAPLLGDVIMWSESVFRGLLRLCCSRNVDASAAESYRMLLKGRERRWAVVAAGRELNYSFNVGEWAGSDAVKGVPLQVLWSNTLSDRWIDEGRRVAAAIPHAKFAYHSGGRWPQEDAAEEISGMISQFVLPLPKSIRRVKDEPIPDHIQKMFDEAGSGQDHSDHHHHHGPGHEHAGFADMYGGYDLGHGWVR